MRYLWIPLVLATACSAQSVTDSTSARSATVNPSLSSSSAVVHSLTGSGIQNIAPGFVYGMSGAIHIDGNGRTWGAITTSIIDLSAYGYPGTATIEAAATCLRVVGNTAYANLVTTKTTDPVLAPLGGRSVIWMRDGGPGAPDVGHGGPAYLFDPNNLICSSTPPDMPANVVTTGNFNVR
jgi:hypothetical protein